MTTTTELARVFAEGYAALGKDFGKGDCCHIYTDGLLMTLGGETDRHLAFRDIFKVEFPEFGEARIDGISVLVVRMDVGQMPANKIPQIFRMPTHYHDHRHEDFSELDLAAILFRELVDEKSPPRIAGDGQHRHGSH